MKFKLFKKWHMYILGIVAIPLVYATGRIWVDYNDNWFFAAMMLWAAVGILAVFMEGWKVF